MQAVLYHYQNVYSRTWGNFAAAKSTENFLLAEEM
jgi:hypothetical protein